MTATNRTNEAVSTWPWWLTLALTTLFVVVPGPLKSPFSGMPLSSKATLVVSALILAAVFTSLFRPQRRTRVIWPIAVLALLVVKLAVAPLLVHSGWKGVYRTSIKIYHQEYSPLRTEWFRNSGAAARPYRIDPIVDFNAGSFGLSYINEMPYPYREPDTEPRVFVQPMVVQWTAYTHAEQARTLRVDLTAAGRMELHVDGRRVFSGRNPSAAAVEAPLAAGLHRVTVTYVKPGRAIPVARILTGEPLTVTPATTAQRRSATLAARAIDLCGLFALLLLAAAFFDAYRPWARSLVSACVAHPDRVVAFLIVVAFVFLAVRTIRDRRDTYEIPRGHDPLAYEGNARLIARNGLLMVDDAGRGEAYFFYPLYSYGLRDRSDIRQAEYPP
jgi:hypothetical protein